MRFLLVTILSGLLLAATVRSMTECGSSLVTALLCGSAAGWSLSERSFLYGLILAGVAIYFGCHSWRSRLEGAAKSARVPSRTERDDVTR